MGYLCLQGGYAANARINARLADFANVSMSGNYSGINWGSVESRVQDRQRNEQIGFDMNANVQLGQFFGKQAKVSLPFFYGYSMGIVNPEYDPFNPDIKLKDYNDDATRKERAKLGQDFIERKSYNFTNVRKEMKAGAKPHFWRASNWSANYAYSETYERDFNTNYDITKTWGGGLNYNYSFDVKAVMPFKNVKFLKKSKWFALVRDFNLYLKPKNVSFGTDLLRTYNERQVRNNIVPDYEFSPVYMKLFNWNRNYALAYDLTKKLKFNFTANNLSIFEEADGQVDRKEDPDGYRVFQDSIKSQMSTLGKAMDYTHSYSINYTLPLDKIPATDWMNASIKYAATYNWQRAPLAQSSFGNIVQNSRNINMTGQLNFTNLYNKVPFFKKVNKGGKSNRRGISREEDEEKGGVKKDENGEEAISEDTEKPESEMTKKELREKRKKERKEKAKEEKRKT